jgi:carboxymethylenebutenolidase
MYDATLAETVTIRGHGGDEIEAYLARPMRLRTVRRRGGDPSHARLRRGDQGDRRTFAVHGYNALMPNLYHRDAPGASPDDAAAAARAKGGVPDERLIGDVAGAAAYLRGLTNSNGKVGVIGYCSGGRQSFLAACSLPLDAAVDCYGAFVVGTPPEGMPLKVGPIKHLAKDLSCPLLGLFGAEDQHPSPEQVAELEKSSRTRARPMSSTPTRAPATRSSRSTARLPPRGRRRRLAQDLHLVRPLPPSPPPGGQRPPARPRHSAPPSPPPPATPRG